jgi:hypothetical protein
MPNADDSLKPRPGAPLCEDPNCGHDVIHHAQLSRGRPVGACLYTLCSCKRFKGSTMKAAITREKRTTPQEG